MKTSERGYGAKHQKIRRKVTPLVESGQMSCARCGEVIAPGEPWDLGHDDLDRSLYAGPEHRKCNRATSARRGLPVFFDAEGNPRRWSREW